MTGLWNKLSSAIDSFGVGNGLLYGVDRMLVACGGRLRLYSYDLMAQPVPEDAPGGSLTADIEAESVTPDDPVLKEFPLDPDVLAHRFDQGATCLIVRRKGEVLGCFWLCEGPFLEDEVRCRFVPIPQDGAVWDFDVYLMPKHRLGRGFLQLWHAAFGYLRGRGRQWSMSRISAFNARSVASHKALGAYVVGRAVFLRGRRWQLMIANRRPFLHASFGDGNCPSLRVRARR